MAVFGQLPVREETVIQLILMAVSNLPLHQSEALDLIDRVLYKAMALYANV
jgi:hypothetical protein